MQLTAKQIKTNALSLGYYEALPNGYTKDKKWPLLIFIHGNGEFGTGLTPVLNNAPMSYIKSGKLEFPGIVIAPQFTQWPYGYHLKDTLDYIVKNYPIDETRVIVAGLSMGGGLVWDIARSPGLIDRISAMIPVCGAADYNQSYADTYRLSKIPVWAFHNDGDPTVGYDKSQKWVAGVGPTAKLTTYSAKSHDAWTKAFDPASGVYEWALSFTTKRGEAPAPVQPVFKSAAIKGTFIRNNCGEGSTGTAIDYTVPAGAVVAATQAAADKLAKDLWVEKGQEFANANATCTAKRVLTQVINVYSDGSLEIEPQ